MSKKFQKKSWEEGKSKNKWIIVGFFFLIFMVVNFNLIQFNTSKFQEILDDGISTLNNLGKSISPPQTPTVKSSLEPTLNPTIKPIHTTIPTKISTSKSSHTSLEESNSALNYINSVRQSHGLNPLQFDDRIYRLALARTSDMEVYHYMDHTNPMTGTCPDNMKYQFGFNSNEYLAENAYGNSRPYHDGIEEEAIESWLGSRGHRYNLLYPHSAGAIVCSGGYCVFLGLNNDQFGEGCYSGEEGTSFWNSVERQPYEV